MIRKISILTRYQNMIGKLTPQFDHFKNPTYRDYLIHTSLHRLPNPPLAYLL